MENQQASAGSGIKRGYFSLGPEYFLAGRCPALGILWARSEFFTVFPQSLRTCRLVFLNWLTKFLAPII
jgi:hypothetical protein